MVVIPVGYGDAVEYQAGGRVRALEVAKHESLARNVDVILEGHHGGDAVLVPEPGRVGRARILAHQEGPADHRHARPSAGTRRRTHETEAHERGSISSSNVGTSAVPERTLTTRVPGFMPARID